MFFQHRVYFFPVSASPADRCSRFAPANEPGKTTTHHIYIRGRLHRVILFAFALPSFLWWFARTLDEESSTVTSLRGSQLEGFNHLHYLPIPWYSMEFHLEVHLYARADRRELEQ